MPIETQASISAWAEDNFPSRNGRDAGIRSQALKLVAEACELALAVGCTLGEIDDAIVVDLDSMTDAEMGERRPDMDAAPAEAADVGIVLAVLSGRLGIDLAAEVDAKMFTNRRRSWDVRPDGSAQHHPSTENA